MPRVRRGFASSTRCIIDTARATTRLGSTLRPFRGRRGRDRFVAELGYEVTVVKDATADYSDEEMHAALDINIPNYASAIVSAEEIVASMRAL